MATPPLSSTRDVFEHQPPPLSEQDLLSSEKLSPEPEDQGHFQILRHSPIDEKAYLAALDLLAKQRKQQSLEEAASRARARMIEEMVSLANGDNADEHRNVAGNNRKEKRKPSAPLSKRPKKHLRAMQVRRSDEDRRMLKLLKQAQRAKGNGKVKIR